IFLLPFRRSMTPIAPPIDVPSPLSLTVNRTPRPFGKKAGQTSRPSSRCASGVEMTSGFPPSADTRRRPGVAAFEKTIVPSVPQLAPLSAPGTWQIVITEPPLTGTFLSTVPPPPALPPKKPIHLPSGEKKGLCPGRSEEHT